MTKPDLLGHTLLAMSTSGAPESSLVSVDVLTLRFGASDDTVLLGVARRELPPYQGRWALPGVLLGRGERLQAAGRRALHSKMGIPSSGVAGMGQLTTFDEPLRDPRGPTLSIAMWAVLTSEPQQDSVSEVHWSSFDQVPELAFDHHKIVVAGQELLGKALWRDRQFTRALLGERFTIRRPLIAVEALTGVRTDRANLTRLLRNSPDLKPTAPEPDGGRGRPAAVWTWT